MNIRVIIKSIQKKTIVFTKARKVTELIYQWITNLGEKYYKKVLELDPKHVEAHRELRLIGKK